MICLETIEQFHIDEPTALTIGKFDGLHRGHEKLISYLSDQSVRYASCSFDIPFNRQQLADFLSVDRSAMSNELSKLRAEGILTTQKNTFHLFAPDKDT